MRDFPMFTTGNGVASLVLREIPYRKKAYIKILDSCEPIKLLEECRDFCCAVGAEEIYASGHKALEVYPVYATLIELQCAREKLLLTDAVAVLLTKETADEWKRIYNERMASVPNASYMDDGMMNKMILEGGGYYIYEQQRIVGIGKVAGNCIEALASIVSGRGEAVVSALAKIVQDKTITLCVAKENIPAMKLYSRLGFVSCDEISRWHKIL